MEFPNRPPSSPAAGNRPGIDRWYLAALSLVLVALALLLLLRGFQMRGAVGIASDPLAPLGELAPGSGSPGMECSDTATLELGLGTVPFPSIEEAAAALGPLLWVAQPSLLPHSLAFTEGAFVGRMLGEFRQTTWSLRYDSEEHASTPTTLFVVSFNAPRFQGPEGEVEPVTVQGREAFLFRPGPEEDDLGVIWREGCRWIYVTADLPREPLLRIADGVRPAA